LPAGGGTASDLDEGSVDLVMIETWDAGAVLSTVPHGG